MFTKPISRRTLLKAGCTAAAAVTLTACSAGSPGSAPAAEKPPVDTPSFEYGEKKENNRILITYATRTGSSVGVASAIGETLGGRGYSVDVKPVKDNPPLEGYQTVLLESAVNGGKWLPEAVDYVKNNQEALNRAQVALISVHIMNLGDDEKATKSRLAYHDDARSLLQPFDEVFFAGIGMNPAEDSAVLTWIIRTFNVIPEGDCRDWDAIRGWAQAVELAS